MEAEKKRLKEDKLGGGQWKRWGPYLSERQWGTVREDYSDDGNCWSYFPHEQAQSRAYRWGEDGLMGITDDQCHLCMALVLWNTKDCILKERLYGLNGHEGNHSEDVKELYFYLDNTPTHSYMKALYKYPQAKFPYEELKEVNKERGLHMPEYELIDTGLFDENKYWDVLAEYCKNSPDDILCRYSISNRGEDTSTLHFLPTLWFRNTWSWGAAHEASEKKPWMKMESPGTLLCWHEDLGKYKLYIDAGPNGQLPEMIFTDNESNYRKLFGCTNATAYVKDAFQSYLVEGDKTACNPAKEGTKMASHYSLSIGPGEEVVIRLRLCSGEHPPKEIFTEKGFNDIFKLRKDETEYFYEDVIPNNHVLERQVARQAYAGLLWSKQFYHYIIQDWIEGDAHTPKPPECRKTGRNSDWEHLYNRDIISMPDKWEYPWYASWDLAFHAIAFANIDQDFAKNQLLLMLREVYMHPNGQIPAYEFNFSDVNPPVHAYAVLKVFKSAGPKSIKRDYGFLARCFHKLLLNFTWWVNRKDPEGRNLFSGGFLGFDNIGVFDRSKPLPGGGQLEQADGTAWMAFFCLIMLEISLVLSEKDEIYEDMASKFFEHFVAIVDAMNSHGDGRGLWNEEEGFYFDHLRRNSQSLTLKVRSMVGFVPFFSCFVLKESDVERHPNFSKKIRWFLKNRKDLATRMSFMVKGENREEALLLSVLTRSKMIKVLGHMLDPKEFFSPFGIRSLSRYHEENPYVFHDCQDWNRRYSVNYQPGESLTQIFGGNSNWRGPIWFCVNYLIVENLRRYDYFYGNDVMVECPTRSGLKLRLKDVWLELSNRLVKLFIPDEEGYRPCHGDTEKYAMDPHFKDLILFYEYFHGETGRGCGASHQTGWTALVVNFLKNLHHPLSQSDSTQSLSSQP